jgi:hypothetical protein
VRRSQTHAIVSFVASGHVLFFDVEIYEDPFSFSTSSSPRASSPRIVKYPIVALKRYCAPAGCAATMTDANANKRVTGVLAISGPRHAQGRTRCDRRISHEHGHKRTRRLLARPLDGPECGHARKQVQRSRVRTRCVPRSNNRRRDSRRNSLLLHLFML